MEEIYTIESSFVDFKGVNHGFTVAAIIEKNPSLITFDLDNSFDGLPSYARVGIGVSVCNTNDEWDSEKGKQIAAGRAFKFVDDSIIITSRAAMNLVTEDSINTLLEKEAEYVKAHPGAFIPGYDDNERNFKKAARIKELQETLTEEETKFLEFKKSHTFSEAYLELEKLTSKN